jgi:hypothetical protein
MNIDLIGSVTLTASAAIMIAALSIGFGSTAMVRTRIAAWLTAWFVFVVILAATRALYYEGELGAPGLGVAVALPIAVLCIVVARTQALREEFHRVPLWLLVGVHVVHLLGISFIILYTGGRLPAPFASAAGWGDIFVGATALPVAWLTYSTADKCSVDDMDLERHRNSRFDQCGRIGSNFLARTAAVDFRRTQLGHHGDFAVALDPRLFGSATFRSSHRDFHSLGEAQRRLTADL